MNGTPDPARLRDLIESKAALARHGIVIIRSVEEDLEPAIMSAARDSISSSPGILNEMTEDELDRYMEGLRKTALKSAGELRDLYTRLLAQLGTEYLGDLVMELDGIGKLFNWNRMAKSVEPVNRKLERKGFRPIRLSAPDEISESLALELEDKWPPAFERFKALAQDAAKQLESRGKKPRKTSADTKSRRKPPSESKKAKPARKKSESKRKR